MKARYSAIGALVGIVFGFLLYFILPQLLETEFTFNQNSRYLLQKDDSVKGGSVFLLGVIPIFTGIAGGVLGYIVGFLKEKLKRKTDIREL